METATSTQLWRGDPEFSRRRRGRARVPLAAVNSYGVVHAGPVILAL